MQDFPQILNKSIVLVLVVSFVVINARPSHLAETPQLLADQDSSNLIDPGYKQWQMELLAQRLAELNQIGNADYGFERALRSENEIKRQSRHRLCYFNPVSCFKK
ncbi:hypothetical protein NQ318_000332 [Aromia moschata]|uniref:Uncharacterized protein n=1 Tax=Aromia moschata TaxID=1265417 RepID=A0AAV8XRP5_9CUCU|nr:hypothetical protein NQ318_000332 [Aromia moschata]